MMQCNVFENLPLPHGTDPPAGSGLRPRVTAPPSLCRGPSGAPLPPLQAMPHPGGGLFQDLLALLPAPPPTPTPQERSAGSWGTNAFGTNPMAIPWTLTIL